MNNWTGYTTLLCRKLGSSTCCQYNNVIVSFTRVFRVLGSWPPWPGPRHFVRGFQEQEMGVQLERERSRTDHVQVFGALCRPQEIAHRQRGTVSIQKYVPIGKRRSI